MTDFRRFLRSAPALAGVVALGVVALAAGPAQAQRFGDPFFDGGGFGGGGFRGVQQLFRIERIELGGRGCPSIDSRATNLDIRGGVALLSIDFNRSRDGRPFQVNGGRVRNCDVRIRFFNDSGRPIRVGLDRVAERVQFLGGGQVRSQFALERSVSGVRTLRLQNTPGARRSNLQLNRLGVRADFSPRRLQLSARIQLQGGGRGNAALRMDGITMELRLAGGPPPRRGGGVPFFFGAQASE
jgi:hypothetical protein